MEPINLEKLETELLLKALHDRYGYDFSHYAPASLNRRIASFLSKSGYQHTADLIPRLLRDRAFFNQLLFTISVTVTEMFRDPEFYRALRESILPVLRTYPSLRIWHAGCATGEEVYSMAILLQEEGIAEHCQLYATDINDDSLNQARQGIFNVDRMREYTLNYQQAGGLGSFSDYYHCRYDSAIMDSSLRQRITFANHNLVSDGIFGEMHLICCRNVLIYFDRELQDRALHLFADALTPRGFLCLGTKETPAFSTVADFFNPVAGASHCYQINDKHQTQNPIFTT
ncbi:CheR family methyltransferase [Desulfuromonas thiophila]|uniref:Chemotaxis protein methyltransferase CheR n=1 Tax=Desulfuromonas thiophila TaxID=57664 RepID=A0A1G7AE68_9BACT|nr:protein-glutamate O-methyltransferase CheR [Desulfuromonas thiophila]SDE13060.1 chemotaxis protein methyltransferase CheR [Desulfuromonas thiophila]